MMLIVTALMLAQLWPFVGLKPTASVGSIGTQTNTDNFNRADASPMGGNWTPSTFNVNFLDLSSNKVVPHFLTSDTHSHYNAWSGGDDHYSQAEITVNDTLADGSGVGVCVRKSGVAATRTMYALVIDSSGFWNIYVQVAGSYSMLTSGTVTYVAGQKLGLSVQGTTLKAWYNGIQIGTVTDSSISTGFPGISYASDVTSGSIDNWDGGTVP